MEGSHLKQRMPQQRYLAVTIPTTTNEFSVRPAFNLDLGERFNRTIYPWDKPLKSTIEMDRQCQNNGKSERAYRRAWYWK